MIIVACPVRDAGNEQVHKGPTFNNVHMQSATNLVDQDGGLSKQTFIHVSTVIWRVFSNFLQISVLVAFLNSLRLIWQFSSFLLQRMQHNSISAPRTS